MPFIGKKKGGKRESEFRKEGKAPSPFSLPHFSPPALPPSIDLALQPEGCKRNLGTIIKKVVLAMREKNLLCPPPTRTSLTLLVAPLILFLHYMLYLPAVQHCKTASVCT